MLLTSLSALMAACGGGQAEPQQALEPAQSLAGGNATQKVVTSSTAGTDAAQASSSNDWDVAGTMTASGAYRTLTQASFGPTPATVARVLALGRGGWLTEQMALPFAAPLAQTVDALYEARLATNPGATPNRRDLLNAFWREALTSESQLRWRVAYALSQIFVVSADASGAFSDPVGYADYFDMVARNAFGNYRQLLEAVALHPAMGRYLTHLGNMPADLATGRVPDENFAREVMQLFSIGLVQLNNDGSVKLGGNGQALPTYGNEDIEGLSRVFTGWSWDCQAGRSDSCYRTKSLPDRYAGKRPMVAYARFHSTAEKRFLGVTIPAQVADPAASLKIALDTLAAHPNVGPFISRQLIQRMVTSNPSPAYVASVAAAFADNGNGVRGDLKAVVRAVLAHVEARESGTGDGKVREPVLRLAALARAFPISSISGEYRFPYTDIASRDLGQSPLRAPSVFNYFRPGFMHTGGALAASGLVAPEMQISDETSVATYVRFMRALVDSSGFGEWNDQLKRPDIGLDFNASLALAPLAESLVADLHERLLGADYPALKTQTVNAIQSIVVPVLNGTGSNQNAIDKAKRDRVRAAILLTVSSPEFIVQR